MVDNRTPTQLLCLFTSKGELEESINFILDNYKLNNPNVFILENKTNPNDLYITFNVTKGDLAVSSKWKTILVHRKKESNTIYTINALNEIVKSKTGGQQDNKFIIEWSEFKNSILTTNSDGYKCTPTKLYDTFKID
jgi:hypothetical protein